MSSGVPIAVSGGTTSAEVLHLSRSLYSRNFLRLCVFSVEFILLAVILKFNFTLGKFLGAPPEISILKFTDVRSNLSKCMELYQFVN